MTAPNDIPTPADTLCFDIVGLEASLHHTLNQVLTVKCANGGDMWYGIEENIPDGAGIIRARLEWHGDRIQRVLELHGELLDFFDALEQGTHTCLTDSSHSLVDLAEQYIRTLAPIAHEDCWYNAQNRFWRQPSTQALAAYNTRIALHDVYALRGLVSVLTPVKLREISFDFFHATKPCYEGRALANDGSHHGKYVFTLRHLYDTFGFHRKFRTRNLLWVENPAF